MSAAGQMETILGVKGIEQVRQHKDTETSLNFG